MNLFVFSCWRILVLPKAQFSCPEYLIGLANDFLQIIIKGLGQSKFKKKTKFIFN